MNTGIIIVIHSIVILLGVIVLIYLFAMRNRVNNLEEAVAELIGDSGKLKKVSVGNYLDISRIKKRLGMNVDEKDSESGVNESKES